jgi:hypothetical protein
MMIVMMTIMMAIMMTIDDDDVNDDDVYDDDVNDDKNDDGDENGGDVDDDNVKDDDDDDLKDDNIPFLQREHLIVEVGPSFLISLHMMPAGFPRQQTQGPERGRRKKEKNEVMRKERAEE